MSRYKSPFNRNTGQPRRYQLSFGSVGGTRIWWSCSWAWRNGRLGRCAGAWAETAGECQRQADEHVATVHWDEAVSR